MTKNNSQNNNTKTTSQNSSYFPARLARLIVGGLAFLNTTQNAQGQGARRPTRLPTNSPFYPSQTPSLASDFSSRQPTNSPFQSESPSLSAIPSSTPFQTQSPSSASFFPDQSGQPSQFPFFGTNNPTFVPSPAQTELDSTLTPSANYQQQSQNPTSQQQISSPPSSANITDSSLSPSLSPAEVPTINTNSPTQSQFSSSPSLASNSDTTNQPTNSPFQTQSPSSVSFSPSQNSQPSQSPTSVQQNSFAPSLNANSTESSLSPSSPPAEVPAINTDFPTLQPSQNDKNSTEQLNPTSFPSIAPYQSNNTISNNQTSPIFNSTNPTSAPTQASQLSTNDNGATQNSNIITEEETSIVASSTTATPALSAIGESIYGSGSVATAPLMLTALTASYGSSYLSASIADILIADDEPEISDPAQRRLEGTKTSWKKRDYITAIQAISSIITFAIVYSQLKKSTYTDISELSGLLNNRVDELTDEITDAIAFSIQHPKYLKAISLQQNYFTTKLENSMSEKSAFVESLSKLFFNDEKASKRVYRILQRLEKIQNPQTSADNASAFYLAIASYELKKAMENSSASGVDQNELYQENLTKIARDFHPKQSGVFWRILDQFNNFKAQKDALKDQVSDPENQNNFYSLDQIRNKLISISDIYSTSETLDKNDITKIKKITSTSIFEGENIIYNLFGRNFFGLVNNNLKNLFDAIILHRYSIRYPELFDKLFPSRTGQQATTNQNDMNSSQHSQESQEQSEDEQQNNDDLPRDSNPQPNRSREGSVKEEPSADNQRGPDSSQHSPQEPQEQPESEHQNTVNDFGYRTPNRSRGNTESSERGAQQNNDDLPRDIDPQPNRSREGSVKEEPSTNNQNGIESSRHSPREPQGQPESEHQNTVNDFEYRTPNRSRGNTELGEEKEEENILIGREGGIDISSIPQDSEESSVIINEVEDLAAETSSRSDSSDSDSEVSVSNIRVRYANNTSSVNMGSQYPLDISGNLAEESKRGSPLRRNPHSTIQPTSTAEDIENLREGSSKSRNSDGGRGTP